MKAKKILSILLAVTSLGLVGCNPTDPSSINSESTGTHLSVDSTSKPDSSAKPDSSISSNEIPDSTPSIVESVSTPNSTPSTGESVSTPESTPSIVESVSTPESTPSTGESVSTPNSTPSTGESVSTPDSSESSESSSSSSVEEPEPTLTEIVLSVEKESLRVGDKTKLNATLAPADIETSVTYRLAEDSEEGIIEISSDGTVTALKEGSVSVVAEADGITSNAVSITVSPAISVAIEQETAYVYVGTSTTLTATANEGGVTWSTENTDIVAVDAETGEVTGLKEGTAIVVATSTLDPTKSDSVEVTVKAPITVSINQTAPSIFAGNSITLSATVTGVDNGQVTWSTENTDIVEVDAQTGEVTGLKEGKAIVVATSNDDPSKSASVEVTVKAAISVVISDDASSVYVDKDITLSVNDNVSVTWSTENTDIVEINSETGKVTGLKPGTATVVATSIEDPTKSDSIEITVSYQPISQITTENTEYTVSGVVAATDYNGGVVSDGEAAIYVNDFDVKNLGVGTYVEVSGVVKQKAGSSGNDHGLLEFSYKDNVTVTEIEGTAPTLPAAVSLTSAIADSWATASYSTTANKLYTWTATAAKSGNFITLNIDGSETMIEPTENGDFKEGTEYEVSAYFVGFDTKYDYASVVIESAEATGETSGEGEGQDTEVDLTTAVPATVNDILTNGQANTLYKLTGVVSEVTGQYGNGTMFDKTTGASIMLYGLTGTKTAFSKEGDEIKFNNPKDFETTAADKFEAGDEISIYAIYQVFNKTTKEVMGIFDSVVTEKSELSYNVTMNDDYTNGTASLNKTQGIYGEEVTLTVTPETGYKAEVYVNGTQEIPSENTVTFNIVPGPNTVSVNFVEDVSLSEDVAYDVASAAAGFGSSYGSHDFKVDGVQFSVDQANYSKCGFGVAWEKSLLVMGKKPDTVTLEITAPQAFTALTYSGMAWNTDKPSIKVYYFDSASNDWVEDTSAAWSATTAGEEVTKKTTAAFSTTKARVVREGDGTRFGLDSITLTY